MISVDIGAPLPVLVYRKNGQTIVQQGGSALKLGPISSLWLIDRLSESTSGKIGHFIFYFILKR